MKLAEIVLWYLGVACAALLLAASVLTHNVILTLIAVALTVVLKRTNKYIPIPRIYAKLGITNNMFQGEASHEKNH